MTRLAAHVRSRGLSRCPWSLTATRTLDEDRPNADPAAGGAAAAGRLGADQLDHAAAAPRPRPGRVDRLAAGAPTPCDR